MVFMTHTYNFITTMYFLGVDGFPEELWFIFEIIAEIILLSDLLCKIVIMKFMPGEWKERWLLQDTQKSIGLFRWTCLVLATIPQSFITSIVFRGNKIELSSLAIAGFRTVKLLRFNEVHKIFETKITETLNQSVAGITRSIQAFYILLISTHVIACSWLVVGRLQLQESWFYLAKYESESAANNLRDPTNFEKYIDALFFVVSTMNGMGYGNIIPSTNFEWFVDILIMIAGCSTWGGFFADFTVELYRKNQQNIDNEEKLEQALQFARHRNLPDEMKDRIKMYYNSLRLKFKELEDKYNLLNQLPLTLKSELSLFFNCELIQKVKFFQLADPTFILAISRCMQPQVCLYEDFVVEVDTVAYKMFFIQIGIVQILATDNKTVIAYQSQGCYFGEIGILLTKKRSCSVKAMTTCTFMFVIKEDLEKILQGYPQMAKFLRAIGKQRLLTTKPEDLTDFAENVFDCGDGENILLDEADLSIQIGERRRFDGDRHINDNKIPHIIVSNQKTEEIDLRSQKNCQIPQDFLTESVIIESKSHKSDQNSQNVSESKQVMNCEIQSTFQMLRRNWIWLKKSKTIPIYLTEEFQNTEEFVIIPLSVFFNVWMFTLVCVTLYFFITVPYRLVLESEMLDESQFSVIFDVISRIFLFIDMFLRYKLGFSINKQNESTIHTKLKLAQRYYIDHILIYDLIASVPILFIFSVFDVKTQIVNLFRITKLFKAVRIIELHHILRKHSNINKTLLSFASYFILMNLSAHYLGCGFIYIRKIQVQQRFDGQSMFSDITNRNYLIPPPQINNPTFYYFDKPMWEMPNFDQYVNLWYFGSCTMGTVMYGDIIPYTMSEQLFDIVVMILARMFLAFLFGKAASYLTSIHTSMSRHTTKINNVKKWIDLNQFPRPLKRRIERFYQLLWSTTKGVKKQDIIQDLPPSLRRNVKNFVFKNIVKNWEIILSSKQDKGVLTSIINNLELKLIPAGEFIIRHGETAEHMFFIIKGQASVISAQGILLATLGLGKNFGEMAILKEGEVRSASVKADTNISVAVMSIKDFNKICDLYSTFKIIIMQVVLKRKLQNMAKINQAVEEAKLMKSIDKKNADQKRNIERFQNREGDSEIKERNIELSQTPIFKEQEGLEMNTEVKFLSTFKKDTKQDEEQKDYFKVSQNLSNKEVSQLISPWKLISPAKPNTGALNQQSQFSLDKKQLGIFTPFQKPQKVPPLGSAQSRASILSRVSGLTPPLAESGVQSQFQLWEMEEKKESELGQRIKDHLTIKKFMIWSVLLVSGYNLIFIPLQFAFRIQFKGIYLVLEFATILIYLNDFTLRVRNIIQRQKKEKIVTDGNENTNEMLQFDDKDLFQSKIRHIKIEAICSLIAAIPLSLIFSLTNFKRPVIIIELLCSLRLLKLMPLKKMFERLMSQHLEKWRIIQVVVYYHLINHYISCLWISLALFESDIRGTWLRRAPILQPLGMRLENNLDGLSNWTIYLHSSFFVANTLSHVGIGAISAVNLKERIFVAILIPIGIFVYVFLYGNIVSIVSELGMNHEITYFEKYKYIIKKIESLELSKLAKSQIDEYFHYIWGNELDIYEDQLLQELPATIKSDLLICKYQEAVENSLIFRDDQGQIDLPLTNSILNLLTPRLYMTGEFIFKAGSIRQNTYIILEGNAGLVSPCEDEQLLKDQNSVQGLEPEVIGVMTPGSHFGNDLPNNRFNYHNRRICHLIALQPCLVGVIESDKIQSLYKCFPQWETKVQKVNEFMFVRCQKYFEKHQVKTKEFLVAKYPTDFQRINNLPLEQLSQKFIIHQYSYSNEEAYEWIFNRVVKYNSCKADEENMIIKQKMFYYNQEGNTFPLFDTKYLEVHKFIVKKANQQYPFEGDGDFTLDNSRTNLQKSDQIFPNVSEIQLISSKVYLKVQSNARRIFEFIQILNLVFIITFTPLDVGFDIEIQQNFYNALFICEIISLLLSCLWIFVNFRTQLIIKGKYTLKFSTIFNNYKKNGLWLDILGIIPLNLIINSPQGTIPVVVLFSILRLIRLPSSWRVIELMKEFEVAFKNNQSNLFFQIVKAIACIFFLGHLVTCLFFFISIKIEEYDPSTPLWVDYNNLRNKPVGDQYLRTLYMVYNITCTVGSGDMFPMTNIELVFFILMVTIGDVFFNLAFGLITNVTLMIAMADDSVPFKNKINQIQNQFVSLNLNQTQIRRVEQFLAFEYKNKDNSNLIKHADLEGYLSHGLREEIKFQASKQMLHKMFAEFNSDNFMRMISIVLKPAIVLPGDFIFNIGEIADSMFFLAEGQAFIVHEDKQTVYEILRKGDFFGEQALLSSKERFFNVLADTFCVVNELKGEDFREIVNEFPEIYDRLKIKISTIQQELITRYGWVETTERVKFQCLSPYLNLNDENGKNYQKKESLFKDDEQSKSTQRNRRRSANDIQDNQNFQKNKIKFFMREETLSDEEKFSKDMDILDKSLSGIDLYKNQDDPETREILMQGQLSTQKDFSDFINSQDFIIDQHLKQANYYHPTNDKFQPQFIRAYQIQDAGYEQCAKPSRKYSDESKISKFNEDVHGQIELKQDLKFFDLKREAVNQFSHKGLLNQDELNFQNQNQSIKSKNQQTLAVYSFIRKQENNEESDDQNEQSPVKQRPSISPKLQSMKQPCKNPFRIDQIENQEVIDFESQIAFYSPSNLDKNQTIEQSFKEINNLSQMQEDKLEQQISSKKLNFCQIHRKYPSQVKFQRNHSYFQHIPQSEQSPKNQVCSNKSFGSNSTKRVGKQGSDLSSRSKYYSQKSLRVPFSMKQSKILKIIGQNQKLKTKILKTSEINETTPRIEGKISRSNWRGMELSHLKGGRSTNKRGSFVQKRNQNDKQFGLYKISSGQSTQTINHSVRRAVTLMQVNQGPLKIYGNQSRDQSRIKIQRIQDDSNHEKQIQSPYKSTRTDKKGEIKCLPMRRLSRVCLGKNLILSQTAGLRMQWTVGQ